MEVWNFMSKHKHCPFEHEEHSVVHKSYMSVVMTRNMYSNSGKCNRISGTPKIHIIIVTWQLKNWNNAARRDGCCYVMADKHISLAVNT
jgi:hypothetical protein